MDSKKFRALLTAVDKGSLTSAAAELGYTQAGMTNMMNSLENELGIGLLIRSKSGVRLSAAGRRLLPDIRAFVEAADRLEVSTQHLRDAGASSLRVGAYSSVARHWLPTILTEFRKICPDTDISISMGGNKGIHDLVRNGELDCAFASCHPSLRHGLDWISVKKDPLVAVLPKDYPVENGVFPVSGFYDEEFLMPSLGFDLDIMPVFNAQEHKVSPHIRYTNLDDAALVSMVEHGLGLTMLSELVMRSMTDDVQVIPIDPPGYREIGIITSERRRNDKVIKRFISCAQNTLLQMYSI